MSTFNRRAASRLAAVALAMVSSAAHAAQTPCLTAGEFSSLASYSLPSIISGTSQRCASTLGPDAFLKRSGGELAARYAANKSSAWPGAKAAFLKLSTSGGADANKLIGGMPDASLQQMLDGMMQGIIGQQIPLERCATIDNVVRLLAPLPAQNTAELIALAAGLGSKSGRARMGALTICNS